ncbi:GNAT family N-acetyltransferase [Sandarakinorhabdus sp.]|uniref:GNAT family N-acetyltransferase n=1 Tax=Sandarakinorhabdus sp. TaxID=1916663 RepID=UPI0028B1C6AB|nr:GNAT family N-acetyltransferase [Sandarakinorhabdus sp.]
MSLTVLQPASAADLDLLAQGLAPSGTILPEGGLETPDNLAMLRDLAAGIRPDFDPAAWLVLAGGESVGLLSLVKPPADGIVTIGYGIAPARRGRNHATAAVRALCDWARQDARVAIVAVETGETNRPSQQVLAANGFACTGRRDDPDDGALLCWSLSVA